MSKVNVCAGLVLLRPLSLAYSCHFLPESAHAPLSVSVSSSPLRLRTPVRLDWAPPYAPI